MTARPRSLLGTLAVVVAVAAGSGCGGDDTPAFCADVDELEQSVRDLGDVDVVNGGLDAVREAVRQVDEDARSVVDSAQDDFPDETAATADRPRTWRPPSAG